jgi:hypothetical protein
MAPVTLSRENAAGLVRAAQANNGFVLMLDVNELNGPHPVKFNQANAAQLARARRAKTPAILPMTPAEVRRATAILQKGGFLAALGAIARVVGPMLAQLAGNAIGSWMESRQQRAAAAAEQTGSGMNSLQLESMLAGDERARRAALDFGKRPLFGV